MGGGRESEGGRGGERETQRGKETGGGAKERGGGGERGKGGWRKECKERGSENEKKIVRILDREADVFETKTNTILQTLSTS